MNALLELRTEIEQTNEAVARAERAFALHPDIPSAQETLRAIVQRQERLQKEFAEIDAVVVARRRLIGTRSQFAARHLRRRIVKRVLHVFRRIRLRHGEVPKGTRTVRLFDEQWEGKGKTGIGCVVI